MRQTKPTPTERVWHSAKLFMVVWTLVTAISLVWNLFYQQDRFEATLHTQAAAFHTMEMEYRNWVIHNGGVYVPVTDKTPPSPWLSHVPERDITTPSGKQLTLLNSSYVVRLVHEAMAKANTPIRASIASLNPINPLNAADAWERQSLEAFAHGVQERASIEVMDDGRTYFRYMKPMVTEEACLKCHAQHGEKLGGIRGGVTVSVPIDDLLLGERNMRNALIGGHGLIWGMGIFGLFCGGRWQQRAIFAAEQAEERVTAVSLYTRSLIEASLDPLVTISAEGRITDVNEATVNATGISREDLIGSDFSDYFTEPEKARAGYREVFAKGFVTDYPLAIRHASGKTMEVLYNASVYHDEKGNVAGVFAAARDVTERKRAEEEVRRLNAELEQRVEARTAELHAANAELYSFAYAVSHDLRAPLRAMSGFSQALKEDYGDHLDGDARGYLDQISLASRHMSDLIDGLLTLARSTRGDLNQETLDISAMAERLLAELSAAEPARRVAWTVEPGMQAQCDATMIEVVMRNLIDNAWKYTDKTPDATIRVYTGETEGQRCFCVSDNGAGFDMTHAGKLFQPFQRLHRQEEFPGIGIGLATVQRIVHRHGGAIWAEGAPGQGATFCFTLLNPGPMDKEIS